MVLVEKLYNPKTKRWIQDTPANRKRLNLPKNKVSPVIKTAQQHIHCDYNTILDHTTGKCIKPTKSQLYAFYKKRFPTKIARQMANNPEIVDQDYVLVRGEYKINYHSIYTKFDEPVKPYYKAVVERRRAFKGVTSIRELLKLAEKFSEPLIIVLEDIIIVFIPKPPNGARHQLEIYDISIHDAEIKKVVESMAEVIKHIKAYLKTKPKRRPGEFHVNHVIKGEVRSF